MSGETFDAARSLHSLAQEVEQREFEGAIGGDLFAGDAESLASRTQRVEMRFHFLQILFAGGIRVDEEGAAGFDIFKHRRRIEIEG